MVDSTRCATGKIYICPYCPSVVSHAKPKEFRHRHYLGDDPVVLFIARQIPEKGYHPLTLSAQHVWKKYPQTRFVFIGPTSSDSRAFFQRSSRSAYSKFGEVSDLDKCSALAACDIFCLPSSPGKFTGWDI
ncbi:MAG: glycosyltransferase family 4 protein [Acaryochloridaceae cyanobacterium RL_2_7]|nr:glycosyltransferase family 4 protein [Acaryochloridaceae cyanobacterium RL_2_7]